MQELNVPADRFEAMQELNVPIGQMETDIVGTLLAGSLVAQVGEDKALVSISCSQLLILSYSFMMMLPSCCLTYAEPIPMQTPADADKWHCTDVHRVDRAHSRDQRLGDKD